METTVSVDMLEGIVKSVFITMMGLDVSNSEAPFHSHGERVTSFVHLTGGWSGAVVFECTKQQACTFAGRILCMDPPESVDDDVRDVIGELANMIGGNMKSGMAPGVRLSMPTVMEGTDYDVRVCGSQLLERLGFECEDGNFWVAVFATMP